MPELHLHLMDSETGEPLPQPLLPEAEALALLDAAEITAAELVPWGSNYTFAVALEAEGRPGHLAIYKPKLGERPLYDFPNGTLYLRERASYLLSRRLGWDLVPPTIVRDGPHGIGSLQIYVASRPEHADDHAFWSRRTPEIERMVLFDHLANNADRKIGHCLVGTDGAIWGIDHGLTFNHVPKLRTVLWQFVGRSIDPALLGDVRRVLDACDDVTRELSGLLRDEEIRAFWDRTRSLLKAGRYPLLDPRRNVPYGWW
ncbi:MAG TPA: hypothetical protein VM450_16200 [Thermomicrobiales bacterium]|nr:hypothetical protein [Thermomicrobiales bacterium]